MGLRAEGVLATGNSFFFLRTGVESQAGLVVHVECQSYGPRKDCEVSEKRLDEASLGRSWGLFLIIKEKE